MSWWNEETALTTRECAMSVVTVIENSLWVKMCSFDNQSYLRFCVRCHTDFQNIMETSGEGCAWMIRPTEFKGYECCNQILNHCSSLGKRLRKRKEKTQSIDLVSWCDALWLLDTPTYATKLRWMFARLPSAWCNTKWERFLWHQDRQMLPEGKQVK